MTDIQTNLVLSCQPKFHTNMVVTPKNIFWFDGGMKNRVKEIRNSLGLSQEKFGEILGISYIQVGRLERGERQLREKTINLYASRLNAAGYHVIPTDFIEGMNSDQTEAESMLLDAFRQISERDQAVVLASLKAFLTEDGKDGVNKNHKPEKKRNHK